MSRRLLRLLTLLFVVGLIAGACGDDDDDGDATEAGGESAASIDTIEEGTLTVCSDIPYAPFEFEEGGEVKGIDADLMRGVGEQLDLDVEFIDTDFDGIFTSLAAGNCDVIASSVSITDERKENNDFSDGYFEINQSVLVRKGEESAIKELADLKGKVVGVQSETTGAAFANENAAANGYTVKEFTGADELFTSLKAKQVAAVLQDFPVNSYNAETSGESAIAIVFDEGEKEEYGFVVKKGNSELVDAINGALDELRESGEYDKILEEYLGEQATS
jgi:polar amino acid transport system substrate-binding protein